MSEETEREYPKDHFLNKYSLFKPRTKRGLFVDYPELKKVPEFRGLNKKQMLLVWYYACEASPLSEINDNVKRMEKAIFYAYSRNGRLDMGKEEAQRMMDFDLPEKILVAFEKMSRYKMGPRVRQKKMIDQMYNNFEKIMNKDVDSAEFRTEDGEVDFDKIAKFVGSNVNITKIMPQMLEMSEGSFGISETDVEDQDTISMNGESLMDFYHDNN